MNQKTDRMNRLTRVLVVGLIVWLCLGVAPLGWGFHCRSGEGSTAPRSARDLPARRAQCPVCQWRRAVRVAGPGISDFRAALAVPQLVRRAVLDIEDAQFYEHGAISLKGMARAALRNLTAAKVKEGGSTITQQLAKGFS